VRREGSGPIAGNRRRRANTHWRRRTLGWHPGRTPTPPAPATSFFWMGPCCFSHLVTLASTQLSMSSDSESHRPVKDDVLCTGPKKQITLCARRVPRDGIVLTGRERHQFGNSLHCTERRLGARASRPQVQRTLCESLPLDRAKGIGGGAPPQ